MILTRPDELELPLCDTRRVVVLETAVLEGTQVINRLCFKKPTP
jgi:hypothetical protein